MKNFVSAICAVVLAIILPVVAFAADAPAERAMALDLVRGFLAQSWPVLALWLISETMPFLPTKANGLVHLVVMWLRTRGGVIGCFALLVLTGGCTTLNVSMNTTAGDNNRPAVKTDAQAEQTVSPKVDSNVGLR